MHLNHACVVPLQLTDALYGSRGTAALDAAPAPRTVRDPGGASAPRRRSACRVAERLSGRVGGQQACRVR